MIIDYLSTLNNIGYECDIFQKTIETIYFDEGKEKVCSLSNVTQYRVYRLYYSTIYACIELSRFLKLNIKNFDNEFFQSASSLDSNKENGVLDKFRFNVESLKLGFKMLRNQISVFCQAFDDEERERINEAIHSYFENCYYSTVVMSVSAIEYRLLKLMCIIFPDLKSNLEKMTLGQLVYEYSKNKDKYKNIVPEKHEPLLNLCNTYRTFSVHPKKQRITPQVANSILNLSIEFLTDRDTKIMVHKI